MKTLFAAQRRRRLQFAFISSNLTWGGSEDLWSEAAAALAGDGHRITIYKNRLSLSDGNLALLKQRGCRLVELASLPLLPNRLYSLLFALAHHMSLAYQAVRLNLSLRLGRHPDLVVISQGGNFDGWLLATVCRRLRLPYVLICQKASELYWPNDRFVRRVRDAYDASLHSFFVSQDNLELTQLQIGQSIPRASVVRNPFKVSWSNDLRWPDISHGIKLACVGRLSAKEKGQDILLRLFASEKWSQRPITLTFFGSGEQSDTLRRAAEYLNVPNVTFAGFSTDIRSLWADHHALALASRAEGLPLVVVEAMLSGRIPIVTNVAGNPEVVEDGVSGFLASAATVDAFDEALERAWQRRDQWRAMGEVAARHIRTLVPPDPARTLADTLFKVANGKAAEDSGRKTRPRSILGSLTTHSDEFENTDPLRAGEM